MLKVTLLTLGASALLASAIVAQQPGQPREIPPEFQHPKNLKVLPHNISAHDLQITMRTWAKSLGVRCGFCHAEGAAKAGERPELNFASDAKDEKRNARKMYTMMQDINHKYLGKIDKTFEISCVSCHRGAVKPMTSVDSLPKPNRP